MGCFHVHLTIAPTHLYPCPLRTHTPHLAPTVNCQSLNFESFYQRLFEAEHQQFYFVHHISSWLTFELKKAEWIILQYH